MTNKRLFQFITVMTLSALLCMTSPGFAQIPNTTKSQIIAQNQSGLSLEQQARYAEGMTLGVSHYNKGEFSQAAKLFQQAAQKYEISSDSIRQALSLSNLSLCYQHLGEWNNASNTITQTITLLENINNPSNQKNLALAQAFDIQGGLQLARGEANAALESWKNATVIYSQQNKPLKALSSQTNQAKALQNNGLYRRAINLLETALEFPIGSTNNTEQLKILLEQVYGFPETATALHTLGDSLRVVGNFPQAELLLSRSKISDKNSSLPHSLPHSLPPTNR